MKITFKLEFNPTKEDIEKYGSDPRTSINKYIEEMIQNSKSDYNNPAKWNVEEDEAPQQCCSATTPEQAPEQAPAAQKQGARVGPDVREGNFSDPFAGTTWGNK
jgi:hypothetical protein